MPTAIKQTAKKQSEMNATKQYYTPDMIFSWSLIRETFKNRFYVEFEDVNEADQVITVESLVEMYPSANRNEVIDDIIYGDSLEHILNYLNQ